VGEIVEVANRFGLVYARVEGRPMVASMLARPWTIGHYARLLAELQAQVHAVRAPLALPTQRERFRWRLERGGRLPPRLQEAALRALEALPDGEALCHADFHHNNVLMTAQGPIIIDWNDSARGDPASDIAWTWILIATGGAPWWGRPLVYWLCQAYRRRALQLHSIDPSLTRRWTAVAAATRLCDDILSGQHWALSLAEKELLH
jgi:aminoglycoside phosphotransferase (APT) family kinase protein